MAKVVITEPALEDLREIQNFIARDSSLMAEIFIDNLIKQFFLLENFPFLGKSVDRMKIKDLRVLVYKSYRILYRVDDPEEFVYILAVVHSSRLLDFE